MPGCCVSSMALHDFLTWHFHHTWKLQPFFSNAVHRPSLLLQPSVIPFWARQKTGSTLWKMAISAYKLKKWNPANVTLKSLPLLSSFERSYLLGLLGKPFAILPDSGHSTGGELIKCFSEGIQLVLTAKWFDKKSTRTSDSKLFKAVQSGLFSVHSFSFFRKPLEKWKSIFFPYTPMDVLFTSNRWSTGGNSVICTRNL